MVGFFMPLASVLRLVKSIGLLQSSRGHDILTYAPILPPPQPIPPPPHLSAFCLRRILLSPSSPAPPVHSRSCVNFHNDKRHHIHQTDSLLMAHRHPAHMLQSPHHTRPGCNSPPPRCGWLACGGLAGADACAAWRNVVCGYNASRYR